MPHPSIIFLCTYYGGFLDRHYRQRPELSSRTYDEQKRSLVSALFGDSDFYSTGMDRAGWTADDLIVNAPPLQAAWSRENGGAGDDLSVAVAQIRNTRPDVLYIHDMHAISADFIQSVRPFVGLVVGQIASPAGDWIPYDSYDIIVSSFPHYVELFRKYGITSYYQPLAFAPTVLASVPSLEYSNRPIDCSFVGGISSLHQGAMELLGTLARSVPIRFWGYGAGSLPEESPVRQRHMGEAWGKEMFYLLASSRITINRHIDVADLYANNMRLYEATGCGALLITDYKHNLHELFRIGEEVVAYRSPEECMVLVDYYLRHPDEAAEIAAAGQKRTLRDHSYALRMEQTAEILERQLRYRREGERFSGVDLSGISTGHTSISPSQVTLSMTSAWKDEGIPVRQRALVQRQLESMYRGEPTVEFRTLADLLRPIAPPGVSVLEIGCASGYYYEILEYLLNRRIDYTGVDYSEALITMARDYYPRASFWVADGASLFFADRLFDIVISSCILLHVPNYRDHIAETCRVSGAYTVLHRTPVSRSAPTRYLKKYAYGVETVELIFNEEELLREFSLNGFEEEARHEYQADAGVDIFGVTYLLRRTIGGKNVLG